MTAITYLIDNLLRAGTQTALLYLVEGLAQRGYRQRVFCLNRRFDAGLVAEIEAKGADVVMLGKARFLHGSVWIELYRALQGTDVVQTFLPFSDIVGRTLGRLARVPVIVTSIRARNIDKKPWQLFLDRMTMRWADRVVFNTRSVVDFSIANEGVRPEQAAVIPNGVRFRQAQGQGRAVLAGIVPDNAYVIGTVGRLRPQKGIDVLLDAFAGLPGDRAHLVIVGDGELRADLAQHTADSKFGERVHFLGMRTDLPDLYAAFDLYAHAAHFEGMPNAVMEAMAAGLPVVATAADGTRELIRDGETGCLVPVGDAAALGKAIEDLLRDSAARRKLGEAAALFMRDFYGVDKMVAAFDDLYRGLIRAKRRV